MPTSASEFVVRGMPGPVATEVAAQIDATAAHTEGFPKVTNLIAFGMAPALAVELAAQMSAEVGNAERLMALGVPGLLATAIKAAIDAA